MCGISGYISYGIGKSKVSAGDALLLNKSIQRRGPDSSGVIKIKKDALNAQLNHSRLAIIDLSDKSNQPYTEEKFENVLVYNGEIYNFVHLIKKYKIPRKFQNSDTLVLYYMLSKYGPRFTLNSIVGMFAFVFFSKNLNTYVVARDRYGEKPLYYSWDTQIYPDTFLFSSDLSGFYNLNRSNAKIDKNSLEQFVQFGYALQSSTFLQDIKEIEPGSYLTITSNEGLKVTITEYFSLDYESSNVDFANGEVKKEIVGNIEKCLSSDANLGGFLSAGLDSTMIMSVASNFRPIKAFTVAYENGDPESEIAKTNATLLGIEHEVIHINQNKAFEELNSYFDKVTEPIGDDSGFLVYKISEMARKDGLKVLLGGDAGDEIFFGYSRMKQALELFSKFKFIPFLNLSKKYKKKSKIGKFWDLNSSSLEEFYVNYFLSSSKKHWYRYGKSFNGSSADRIRKVEIDLYLRKNGFKKLDYNTMLMGIEGRTPLASHRIIQSFKLKAKDAPDIRSSIFKEIINSITNNYKLVPKKSGFGIKNNVNLLNELKQLNQKDDILLDLFGVPDLNNKFNLDDFVVNFRLRSISKFLANYNLDY